jgi:arabinofuranosyltransferase
VLPPPTRLEQAALAGALVVAAALMWPLRHYLTDDTFIHLQYARHLAHGEGLVFNVGERVYGCTSPLWAALLATAIALHADGLAAARLLGTAATLASVALFWQLLRRNLRTPALVAAGTLAWAAHAWMLRWSTSGMETAVAVALTLAGFVAFTEGMHWGARPVRTGAMWALAALTRPEAALLLVLWGIFVVVDADTRAGALRLVWGVLPPVAIYGGWLAFAWLYYHAVLPQTLSAKAAGSALAGRLESLARELAVAGLTDGVLAVVLLVSLVPALRARHTRAVRAQKLVPWAWVVCVPALYLARGVPVLSRYLVPLLPVMAWLAWEGLERLLLGDAPSPARTRRVARAGVVLAALVIAQNLAVWRWIVVPQVRSFSPALQSSLVRWGVWFREHAARDAAIATPDIGAIGYFSDRRVVDLGGLVTPAMVPFLAREEPEVAIANFRFAAFSRPAFIVDRATQAWDLAHRSPFRDCLVPVGLASVPNLGVARPGPRVYSFYRIRWDVYEREYQPPR